MIAYLKGVLLEKNASAVVVETGGIGYEVFVSSSSLRRIGETGNPVELFVSESIGMYGGGTTFYGFLSREEKDIFLCLREHVPATGAKKALEHLDKASKSLPDFRRAILEGDARILAGVFGFTSKTAEKLVAALKDKIAEGTGSGGLSGRLIHVLPDGDGFRTRATQQALDALIALGYRQAESRQMLQTAVKELEGKNPSVEELIRLALKRQ